MGRRGVIEISQHSSQVPSERSHQSRHAEGHSVYVVNGLTMIREDGKIKPTRQKYMAPPPPGEGVEPNTAPCSVHTNSSRSTPSIFHGTSPTRIQQGAQPPLSAYTIMSRQRNHPATEPCMNCTPTAAAAFQVSSKEGKQARPLLPSIYRSSRSDRGITQPSSHVFKKPRKAMITAWQRHHPTTEPCTACQKKPSQQGQKNA